MTPIEIGATIDPLSRAESLRTIQLLSADVPRDRNVVSPDRIIPIWSPTDSFEGASTLLRVLDKHTA